MRSSWSLAEAATRRPLLLLKVAEREQRHVEGTRDAPGLMAAGIVGARGVVSVGAAERVTRSRKSNGERGYNGKNHFQHCLWIPLTVAGARHETDP